MAFRVGPGQLFHANPELQQLLFLFLFCKRAKNKQVIRSGFDYAGFKGQAQARIEDYAQEWPTASMSAAVGEQRIVGNHRADSDQKRVMPMAKLLHMGAG